MKVFALLFAAAAATGVAAQDENLFAQACDNKSVGDTCTFTQPNGEETSGTCFAPASSSACGPGYDSSSKCVMCGEADPTSSGGAPNTGDAKVSPSVTACEDASEGDTCAFVGADGNKNTGVCADEGAGACGPGYEDSSTPCYICNTDPIPTGDDGDGGSNASNECSDLSLGDTCYIVRGEDTITGVCEDTEEDIDTGDGKMSCSPVNDNKDDDSSLGGGDDSADTDPGVSSVLEDACDSMSEGDTCNYVDAESGNKVTGVCATDGSRESTLQCDNETTGTDSSEDDPLVDACNGKQEGAECSADFGITTITGGCATSEDGDLYCSPQVPTANDDSSSDSSGSRRYLRN